MKILMVCLGNICRSPLAQGIMESKIRELDLPWKVDSCGTGSWHIGEPPDQRSIDVARRNGIDIRHQRARQIQKADVENFDLILAMDNSNYLDIMKMTGSNQKNKVQLIMDFEYPGQNRVVPDPYLNGGFDHVYDILDSACSHVISHLKR